MLEPSLNLIAPKKTTKVSSSDSSSVSSSIAATSALKMTGCKYSQNGDFICRNFFLFVCTYSNCCEKGTRSRPSIQTSFKSGRCTCFFLIGCSPSLRRTHPANSHKLGLAPMVAWSTLRPAITRCYGHHPHHGLVVGSHV